MASNFVLRLAEYVPRPVKEVLKKRVHSKSFYRHKQILNYISKTDDVLDIGCVRHSLDDIHWQEPNPGEWLHAEIRQQAATTLGIDMEQAEVEKLQKKGLNVTTANAETFDFEQSFDVIVAGELIEHLSNPGNFLQRCGEHLRENGNIIISTPNPRDLQIIYWYTMGQESRVNPEHTAWFDQYVIEELISRHGFELSEWEYYPPSISILNRSLYQADVMLPLTAGGFIFVLSPN
jgi:2-polyprenyl-3-methyl-5-hydroxy-6-metoxy-1,4-benzoquinol methylase